MGFYTPEEDRTILECVAESLSNGNGVLNGLKTAAKKIKRSFYSVEHRYRDHLKKKQEKKKSPEKNTRAFTPKKDTASDAAKDAADKAPKVVNVQEAIAEMVSRKGFRHVKKEDITEIAEKAGEHYHSALSAWGSVWSSLKAIEKPKNCPWCRAKEVTQMRAEGLTYSEIGRKLGISQMSALNLHKTYRLFPGHRDTLPFSCYVTIARACPTEPPEEWATFAEENHLTVKELQKAIKMPLQEAKEKFGKQKDKPSVTYQASGVDNQDPEQKIASLYTTVYDLQQDLKGLNALVSNLQEEKAALQEGVREQHRKAVFLLKKAHAREKMLLSVLKAVAEEAGVPAGWKRAADVTAEDANRLVKAVRGARKLNMVYIQMLKNKNPKKTVKKGA
jgi:hypothetical protein